MNCWLYQISQKTWPPERFRLEVWENERWSWRADTFRPDESELPQRGDSVAFYYAKTGGADPGFYGWAVVLEDLYEAPDGRYLYFRPVTPTNHLKMYPWWDSVGKEKGEAEKLADEIRGPMPEGTMFRATDAQWGRIRRGITVWVSGGTAEMAAPAGRAA